MVKALTNRLIGRSFFPALLAYAPLLFLCLYAPTALAQSAASIQLHSEQSEVFPGDVVAIEVESIGLLDPLDIAPLKEAAAFLRETTGTRIAVFNGKVVEIALRRMEFVPEQEGTIDFGPLIGESTSGTVRSNAITVAVLPRSSNIWQPGAQDTAISMRISKNKPVFGEQVELNIEMRHSYVIADEMIELPSFEKFDVVPLFEERRTIDSDSGYRQLSWRYLLHPRQSGTLSIGPVQWRGTMIKSRTQRGQFAQRAEPLILQVQSVSADYGQDHWWIPATELGISESWSQDLALLSAGDEVIRTITLEARGVLASQLPIIEPPPSRSVQSVLINTDRQQVMDSGGIRSTGIYTYRVSVFSPIPVFFDTVRVPWWNVVTNQKEESIIPARRVNVGLPERADLLAQLSMGRSLSERWLYRIRTSSQWLWLSSLGIAAALIGLLWLDGKAIQQTIRKQCLRFWLVSRFRKLQRQSQWQALYRLLQETSAAIPNRDALFDVRQLLDVELFGSGGGKPIPIEHPLRTFEFGLLFNSAVATEQSAELPPL